MKSSKLEAESLLEDKQRELQSNQDKVSELDLQVDAYYESLEKIQSSFNETVCSFKAQLKKKEEENLGLREHYEEVVKEVVLFILAQSETR